MTSPWVHWWTDSTSPLHQPTFPRLLLAMVLGACVGAERQWRQRPAGLRTNTLVCFGAAAYVDLAMTIAPNTTQVIAYVVSGVGFLGAGAIMKDGGNVRGLNTAATLWCSAAVGACVGAGEMLDGVFVAVLLISINSVLRPLARFLDRRSLVAVETHILYRVRVVCDSELETFVEHQIAQEAATRPLVLRGIRFDPIEGKEVLVVQAIFESATKSTSVMNDLAGALRTFPWAQSVDWEQAGAEGE